MNKINKTQAEDMPGRTLTAITTRLNSTLSAMGGFERIKEERDKK